MNFYKYAFYVLVTVLLIAFLGVRQWNLEVNQREIVQWIQQHQQEHANVTRGAKADADQEATSRPVNKGTGRK